MNVKNGSMLKGRYVEWFCHNTEKEWGYEKDQSDSFAVIHPKEQKEGEKYPLYVVFHSAGHDLYSTFVCLCEEGNHDIYHSPDFCYALILDCRANEKDWWWGGADAHLELNLNARGTELSPVENRCIDTVKWVMDNYPINREKVYAVGNSMGGSGALGIGLNHGDIFTAIKANVPAGAYHAADRCDFDGKAADGFKIPDPPLVIDYSSPKDGWSDGHEVLYSGMKKKKFALMGFWGDYGHENNNERIAACNDLIHSFDIFSMNKSESYPVFTNASTDSIIPWPDDRQNKNMGQVNGFFRWKNVEDTENRYAVSLNLLRQNEWQSRETFPTLSVADVTPRRLQEFRPVPGETYKYSFGDISGEVKADVDGLITIEKLPVTDKDTLLVITK